jgi:pimeloyl-ACP methyl ester carboxylesterase
MAQITEAARAISVHVPVGGSSLEGDLVVPAGALGIVLFAHGSGSSRFSTRNQFVARALKGRRLATLLIDLLTSGEEVLDAYSAQYRFDIPMLASRLIGIVDWLKAQPLTAGLPVGLFGASTGGGAALIAAADRPADIRAVVSRGGRPDLAGVALRRVAAPTLLIVGSRDEPVIEMNHTAMKQMTSHVTLEIVPGASHLFEEPGTLEQVADLAAGWFEHYLRVDLPEPPR